MFFIFYFLPPSFVINDVDNDDDNGDCLWPVPDITLAWYVSYEYIRVYICRYVLWWYERSTVSYMQWVKFTALYLLYYMIYLYTWCIFISHVRSWMTRRAYARCATKQSSRMMWTVSTAKRREVWRTSRCSSLWELCNSFVECFGWCIVVGEW